MFLGKENNIWLGVAVTAVINWYRKPKIKSTGVNGRVELVKNLHDSTENLHAHVHVKL